MIDRKAIPIEGRFIAAVLFLKAGVERNGMPAESSMKGLATHAILFADAVANEFEAKLEKDRAEEADLATAVGTAIREVRDRVFNNEDIRAYEAVDEVMRALAPIVRGR